MRLQSKIILNGLVIGIVLTIFLTLFVGIKQEKIFHNYDYSTLKTFNVKIINVEQVSEMS